MRGKPKFWHLAALVLPAGAAAIAALAATRSSDLEDARSRRETAERLLAKMDRRIFDLAEEERKFEAEIVRVEDRYRRLAVDRAALRKAFESAFGIKHSDLEIGHLIIAWKGDLAAEILSMEGDVEALQRENQLVSARLEALNAERAGAPPERRAELDAGIGAARRELEASHDVIRKASADVEASRRVLANR